MLKKDWLIDVKGLMIDKSLNWKLAKIIHVGKLSVTIETDNGEKGFIDFKNVSWARKKSFEEFLNLNDIVYVKLRLMV